MTEQNKGASLQGTVWKRVSPLDLIIRRSQQLFFYLFSHFRHGEQPNDQMTKQPDDPRASLLLTTETAVFCKRIFFAFVYKMTTLGIFFIQNLEMEWNLKKDNRSSPQ